eukprot:TRINITY_DN1486_c0_g2_i1.p1 TRINITY_DN1486_c0_g2~~TRINITY_DN1486_c0_g2_i1.p1  ORF type:complete len:590 (+),score=115.76 TRINITY_DN1486_c0_g2_i1:89-1771(+)
MATSARVALFVSCALQGMQLVAAGFFSQESKLRGADAPLVASRWAASLDQHRLATHSLSEALKDSFSAKHHAALQKRIEALKETLRPMFAALPKNSEGRLDHATARYALHRHFVSTFSAYIIGLEPIGDTWNASSPLESLGARLPKNVQERFSQHMENHGFDLQELALFGASLEVFISLDAELWLKEAYELTSTSQSLSAPLDSREFKKIVDVFLWIFFGKHRRNKKEPLNESVANMISDFPDWIDFQSKITLIQQRVANSNKITFDDAAVVVDAFMNELGPFQLEVCNAFEDALIKKDHSESGRVKLSEFYGSSLLSEKPDTLRAYGVVAPESDGYAHRDPSVIISNYVNSAANCVASTQHYALCCPDACLNILSQLESRLARPSARPEQILEIISALPSRTRTAPRQLADFMLTRLRDIGEHHDGMVPLHGRLFAQWLHHAYPYECMFPMPASHAGSGLSSVDWHRNRKNAMYFSDEEAQEFVKNRVKDLEGGDLQETLAWLVEEKVFVQAPPPPLFEEVCAIARCVAFCGALFGAFHALLSHVRPHLVARGGGKARV